MRDISKDLIEIMEKYKCDICAALFFLLYSKEV